MTGIIVLPRELTIYRVAELRDTWRTAIQKNCAGPAPALPLPDGIEFPVEAAQVDEVVDSVRNLGQKNANSG